MSVPPPIQSFPSSWLTRPFCAGCPVTAAKLHPPANEIRPQVHLPLPHPPSAARSSPARRRAPSRGHDPRTQLVAAPAALRHLPLRKCHAHHPARVLPTARARSTDKGGSRTRTAIIPMCASSTSCTIRKFRAQVTRLPLLALCPPLPHARTELNASVPSRRI